MNTHGLSLETLVKQNIRILNTIGTTKKGVVHSENNKGIIGHEIQVTSQDLG